MSSELQKIVNRFKLTQQQVKNVAKRIAIMGEMGQKGAIREIQREITAHQKTSQSSFQQISTIDNIGDPSTSIFHCQSTRKLFHHKRLKLLLLSKVSKQFPIHLLTNISQSLNDLIVFLLCGQNVVVEGLSIEAVQQFVKCFQRKIFVIRKQDQRQGQWIMACSNQQQELQQFYHVRFNSKPFTQAQYFQILKQYRIYHPNHMLQQILQNLNISNALIKTHLITKQKDPFMLIKWIEESQKMHIYNKGYLQNMLKIVKEKKKKMDQDLKVLDKIKDNIKTHESQVKKLNRLCIQLKRAKQYQKYNIELVQSLNLVNKSIKQIQTILKRFDNKQLLRQYQNKHINPALTYFSDILRILFYSPLKAIEPSQVFVCLQIKQLFECSFQQSKQDLFKKMLIKKTGKQLYSQLNEQQLQLLQPYIRSLPQILQCKYMQKFSGVCYHWIKIIQILINCPRSYVLTYLIHSNYTQDNYKQALQNLQKLLTAFQKGQHQYQAQMLSQSKLFQSEYKEIIDLKYKNNEKFNSIILDDVIEFVQHIQTNIFINSIISGFYKCYNSKQQIGDYFSELGFNDLFLHLNNNISAQYILYQLKLQKQESSSLANRLLQQK